MARRRLTVKRIDPWSMLKFGFIANIVFLVIFLMLLGVVWFIVDRLQLIDQVCGIATDVGFTDCGINAPNLFRSAILLGLLWVVVQTAILVFLAFLYNLIADLTGGLGLTIVDDSLPASSSSPGTTPRNVATADHHPGSARSPGTQPAERAAPQPAPARQGPPPRPSPDREGDVAGVTADAATRARRGRSPATDEDLFDGR